VELGDRLAVAGADLLVRTLAELASIVPQKQDEAQATYAPILKKEDGEIDWTMFTRDILNRIRGFEPWPGCYTFWDGQRIRIWKAQRLDLQAPPQGWFARKKGRLTAGTGNGGIEILEVQLEGKKRMETAAFLNGFPDT
jgi:methionyl-tRNA formyltransferase